MASLVCTISLYPCINVSYFGWVLLVIYDTYYFSIRKSFNAIDNVDFGSALLIVKDV